MRNSPSTVLAARIDTMSSFFSMTRFRDSVPIQRLIARTTKLIIGSSIVNAR
jgi:hypothetical protein